MNIETKDKYYCPMHCEGEKTYDQPGTCPICEMYLVPIRDNEHTGMKSGEFVEGAQLSQAGKYYCPMKCEGEKTYSAPGNCPVCNMKLVPVTG